MKIDDVVYLNSGSPPLKIIAFDDMNNAIVQFNDHVEKINVACLNDKNNEKWELENA